MAFFFMLTTRYKFVGSCTAGKTACCAVPVSAAGVFGQVTCVVRRVLQAQQPVQLQPVGLHLAHECHETA